MKSVFITLCASALLLCGCHAEALPVVPGQEHVKLQSPYWQFSFGKPACILTTSQAATPLQMAEGAPQHFAISLTAHIRVPHTRHSLLEIPGVLDLCLRQHEPSDRGAQNYPAYPMPDGTVPVLEATLMLQSHEGHATLQPLVIGIPLALLPQPEGEHQIVLHFSGVCWSLYVDGRIYDNEFALGYPPAHLIHSWRIDPERVSQASLFDSSIQPTQVAPPTPLVGSHIQYWTPPFHNAWVGDVATIYHNGRYHVFYLFDRRGHASKLGRGGHYFEHLSTTDFHTWTEHEPATPLEHQWETFGTGTPFVWQGKLCLSYGLHTTRIYPRERTTLPMQWSYLEQNGHSLSIQYDTLHGLMPAGSTYSVSEDGVAQFRKTHTLFHPCENPSIYVSPQGQLSMLANYGARGTWQADSVQGGWRCTDPHFPLGGDCTFPFHWRGYDYIIGGFNRLWWKAQNETDYRDMVAEGRDFYNGLSVPAISAIPGHRYLMAGWLKTQHWGGPLVIHELVAGPSGTIGSKWMPELVPYTLSPTLVAELLTDTLSTPAIAGSYILTFDIHPQPGAQGRVAVDFLPTDDHQPACQWQLALHHKRAQYATLQAAPWAPEQKTLRQGGDVSTARDYAIENGMELDGPFGVRMLVHISPKLEGPIIDTEIAQQRTMLSYRPGLDIARIAFRAHQATIRNIQLAPVCQ